MSSEGDYWNAENFRTLKDKSGVTMDELSSATGLSLSSLHNYYHGRTQPSLVALIKLAQYFAMPIDYFVGLCEEKDTEDAKACYAERFMQMRKAPWESYLMGRHRMGNQYFGTTIEAPWPYNLLDDLINPYGQARWDSVINDDQLAGLEYAISTLDDRTQKLIYGYYRDGMTLHEVAQANGITAERVRQIVAKGVRFLRHPMKRKFVELGLEGAKAKNDYDRRMLEISQDMEVLSELEASLRARYVALGTALAMLPNNSEIQKASVKSAPIDELDLTVRSWNCLRRAGIKTVGDACEAAKEGRLTKIRALGRKSLDEILTKIQVFTGESYWDVYGIDKEVV